MQGLLVAMDRALPRTPGQGVGTVPAVHVAIAVDFNANPSIDKSDSPKCSDPTLISAKSKKSGSTNRKLDQLAHYPPYP